MTESLDIDDDDDGNNGDDDNDNVTSVTLVSSKGSESSTGSSNVDMIMVQQRFSSCLLLLTLPVKSNVLPFLLVPVVVNR